MLGQLLGVEGDADRHALDPKELAEHPLRVGLSMDAVIDVSK